MTGKKDKWDELDIKIDEESYSIIEWTQFFESLMNKEIPINSNPVFADLTAKDLVRLQEKLLSDFEKDLNAIEQIGPKIKAHLKEIWKYHQLKKGAEQVLKQFKEFLERSAKNG